jgi:hypothetical protein
MQGSSLLTNVHIMPEHLIVFGSRDHVTRGRCSRLLNFSWPTTASSPLRSLCICSRSSSHQHFALTYTMAFRSLDRASRIALSTGRRSLPLVGRGCHLARFYTSTNLPAVDRSYGFGSTKSLVGLIIGKISSRRGQRPFKMFKFRSRMDAELESR